MLTVLALSCVSCADCNEQRVQPSARSVRDGVLCAPLGRVTTLGGDRAVDAGCLACADARRAARTAAAVTAAAAAAASRVGSNNRRRP